MSIEHDPVVFREVSKVEPIAVVYESIVNRHNSDVTILSHLVIRQTVVILETTEPVVIVVPEDRLIQ